MSDEVIESPAPEEDAAAEEPEAQEPGTTNPAEASIDVVSVEGDVYVHLSPEPALAVDQRHPNLAQGGRPL